MGHLTPGTPPNILLLFTDQQRADTIAALGNPVIQRSDWLAAKHANAMDPGTGLPRSGELKARHA